MENIQDIKRSELFTNILEIVQKLKLADSNGKDCYDHGSISYELEQLILTKEFNLDEIKGNYYIEVKVITGGVLQMNDNSKIIDEFRKLGFDFKGESVIQDDGNVSWSFLEKNKGFEIK